MSPPWGADSRWDRQITYMETKFITVLTIAPLAPTMIQMKSVHTITKSHRFKINFNIILPSAPRSYKRSLPFRLSNTAYAAFNFVDCSNF